MWSTAAWILQTLLLPSMAVKHIALLVKMLNLITGVGLVVVSAFSILDVDNYLTFQIFLIPCPFFVAFFGICIIGAELKVKAILSRLEFLNELAGRGLFNVFLSSLAFWFLQKKEWLAWTAASILFVIGVVYIALHCGYNDELREAYEKEERKAEREKIISKAKSEGHEREGLV